MTRRVALCPLFTTCNKPKILSFPVSPPPSERRKIDLIYGGRAYACMICSTPPLGTSKDSLVKYTSAKLDLNCMSLSLKYIFRGAKDKLPSRLTFYRGQGGNKKEGRSENNEFHVTSALRSLVLGQFVSPRRICGRRQTASTISTRSQQENVQSLYPDL